MRRRRHPVLRGVLLFFLFLAIALYALATWVRAPGGARPATVEFPIGTKTRVIFRELANRKLVRHAFVAEAYYRVFYRFEPLRAGEYAFSGSEGLDRIIGMLTSGEVVRHTVIVPEGLTDAECFRLFLDQRVGTERGFERAVKEVGLVRREWADYPDLEGFLFPDTYVVTRSTPTREIVTRMLENFDRHFSPEMRRKAGELGLSVRDAVTLASLVEKETSLPSERPRVAAVYLNRLRMGMRLQCDPTVIYALVKDARWKGKLHRSELEYESPYNTYLHAGLPPGPICNPGAASLSAAIEPARSLDLYFVARGDGGHYFSRTYGEHLQKIVQSRQNSQTLDDSR
jgi:UPF0755 protein